MAMRTIEPSDLLRQEAQHLATNEVGRSTPIGVLCTDAATNARLFSTITKLIPPNAIAVHIPCAPDQVERLVLSIGQGLGSDVSERLSGELSRSGATLKPTLDLLGRELHARSGTLVVHGWDALGGFGSLDQEMRRALEGRSAQLSSWLSEQPGLHLSKTRMGLPSKLRASAFPVQHEAPPVYLSGADATDSARLWEQVGYNGADFDLYLAAFAVSKPDSLAIHLSDEDLRHPTPEDVFDLLGPGVRRLLFALTLHGRPIPESLLRGSEINGTRDDIERGSAIGLWFPVGDQLLVHPRWRDWCDRELPGRVRDDMHRTLARAFRSQVQPDDPRAGRMGLCVLEAHRHYLASGETAQALQFARFGSTLLVARARELSLNARTPAEFVLPSDLYQRARDLQKRQPGADPASVCAYTVHYLHFNRAKAGLEGMEQTAEGYRESIDLWTEHALFWSRYIRSLFYLGRRGEAMDALCAALDPATAVPQHPNRLPTLIERTVDRLLDKPGHLLDAIEVWAEHIPTEGFGLSVEQKLRVCLLRGWTAGGVELTDGTNVAFHRDATVRVHSIAPSIWQAEVSEASFRQRGESPRLAVRALVNGLRERASALVRVFTHTLSASDRLEKQNLLGVVDVVASGLDAKGPEAFWMWGNLRPEGAGLALHTHGSRHLVFPLPAELERDKVSSDQLWCARIQAGPSGVPTGPVLELRPAISEDDLVAVLKRWERRFAHGD